MKKSAVQNIRDMAGGYEARGMAFPSLLRDLVAAADEVEAQQAERDELRRVLQKLYDACIAADLQEDLSPLIDGSLLDDAADVLSALRAERTGENHE